MWCDQVFQFFRNSSFYFFPVECCIFFVRVGFFRFENKILDRQVGSEGGMGKGPFQDESEQKGELLFLLVFFSNSASWPGDECFSTGSAKSSPFSPSLGFSAFWMLMFSAWEKKFKIFKALLGEKRKIQELP